MRVVERAEEIGLSEVTGLTLLELDFAAEVLVDFMEIVELRFVVVLVLELDFGIDLKLDFALDFALETGFGVDGFFLLYPSTC